MLRNATLEDDTWRTVGGASRLGSVITGTPDILAAIDYFPTSATQRTVVMTDDGRLQKDDGSGGGWTELLSGLTVSGARPSFTIGGAEEQGRDRKLFYADGANQERVLAADGSAFAALATPPTDWAGANRPRKFVNHDGYLWAFGNANAPHLVYRSLRTNHEDFRSTIFAVPVFSGEGEYLVNGLSYKGGLLLWKYPEGVYFYNTLSADSAEWFVTKVGQGGSAGPNTAVLIEDDVLWVDPFGGWHLISATQATGSVRAEDLTYRKLGRYLPDNISRTRLPLAHLVYYSDKLQALLACSASGSSVNDRIVAMDVARRQSIGERWVWHDRDVAQALFLRKVSDVLIPAIGDDAGQVWELDRSARNRDGAGYTFEWWTADSDFSQFVDGWAGKLKNLHYLQLIYDPRSVTQHTVEVLHDGVQRQTVTFDLTSSGITLPAELPATFGAEGLQATRIRRLRGQARRLSLRGSTSAADADASIAGAIIGVGLAGGA